MVFLAAWADPKLVQHHWQDLQGQASIVQLTQASLSQTEAFKNLKDLLLWPDPQDERSDEEEPNHDTIDPMAAVNALLDTNKGTHVAKSADGQDQHSTTEQDIIDSLTQALKSKPKKSPPIDAKIASLVDDILTGDLSAFRGRKEKSILLLKIANTLKLLLLMRKFGTSCLERTSR